MLSRLWHLLFSASPALFGSWLSSIPAESIVTTLAAKQQWAALVYVLSLSLCPIGLIADFSHNVARLRRPGGGSVRGAAYAALAKSALFAFGLIWIHGQIFSAVGLCDGAPCREDPSFFEDNRRLGEHWHVVHDHWIAMYYAIITWTTTGYGDFVPPPSLSPPGEHRLVDCRHFTDSSAHVDWLRQSEMCPRCRIWTQVVRSAGTSAGRRR